MDIKYLPFNQKDNHIPKMTVIKIAMLIYMITQIYTQMNSNLENLITKNISLNSIKDIAKYNSIITFYQSKLLGILEKYKKYQIITQNGQILNTYFIKYEYPNYLFSYNLYTINCILYLHQDKINLVKNAVQSQTTKLEKLKVGVEDVIFYNTRFNSEKLNKGNKQSTPKSTQISHNKPNLRIHLFDLFKDNKETTKSFNEVFSKLNCFNKNFELYHTYKLYTVLTTIKGNNSLTSGAYKQIDTESKCTSDVRIVKSKDRILVKIVIENKTNFYELQILLKVWKENVKVVKIVSLKNVIVEQINKSGDIREINKLFSKVYKNYIKMIIYNGNRKEIMGVKAINNFIKENKVVECEYMQKGVVLVLLTKRALKSKFIMDKICHKTVPVFQTDQQEAEGSTTEMSKTTLNRKEQSSDNKVILVYPESATEDKICKDGKEDENSDVEISIPFNFDDSTNEDFTSESFSSIEHSNTKTAIPETTSMGVNSKSISNNQTYYPNKEPKDISYTDEPFNSEEEANGDTESVPENMSTSQKNFPFDDMPEVVTTNNKTTSKKIEENSRSTTERTESNKTPCVYPDTETSSSTCTKPEQSETKETSSRRPFYTKPSNYEPTSEVTNSITQDSKPDDNVDPTPTCHHPFETSTTENTSITITTNNSQSVKTTQSSSKTSKPSQSSPSHKTTSTSSKSKPTTSTTTVTHETISDDQTVSTLYKDSSESTNTTSKNHTSCSGDNITESKTKPSVPFEKSKTTRTSKNQSEGATFRNPSKPVKTKQVTQITHTENPLTSNSKTTATSSDSHFYQPSKTTITTTSNQDKSSSVSTTSRAGNTESSSTKTCGKTNSINVDETVTTSQYSPTYSNTNHSTTNYQNTTQRTTNTTSSYGNSNNESETDPKSDISTSTTTTSKPFVTTSISKNTIESSVTYNNTTESDGRTDYSRSTNSESIHSQTTSNTKSSTNLINQPMPTEQNDPSYSELLPQEENPDTCPSCKSKTSTQTITTTESTTFKIPTTETSSVRTAPIYIFNYRYTEYSYLTTENNEFKYNLTEELIILKNFKENRQKLNFKVYLKINTVVSENTKYFLIDKTILWNVYKKVVVNESIVSSTTYQYLFHFRKSINKLKLGKTITTTNNNTTSSTQKTTTTTTKNTTSTTSTSKNTNPTIEETKSENTTSNYTTEEEEPTSNMEETEGNNITNTTFETLIENAEESITKEPFSNIFTDMFTMILILAVSFLIVTGIMIVLWNVIK